MSEDGRVLGLCDQRGVVHVASARIDRFVSDSWAPSQRPGGRQEVDRERGRGGERTRLPHRHLPLSQGPWRVAMVSDEQRLTEACASADIVSSTIDAQARCRGPRLVIDRRDAWREGAQALWLDEQGVRRATDNAVRGDRPWVANSSTRRAAVKAPGA